MDREKKNFRTGRYERWRRLRYLAWVAFPFVLVKAAQEHGPEVEGALAASSDPTMGMASIVVMLLLQAFLIGFAPFFLWWCLCTFLMVRARREASFVPTEDLEYYRERLKGLSAVQVSLLADLRVEPREDAVATLLSLVLRGILRVDGAGFSVRDEASLRGLSQSERSLVQMVSAGELGESSFSGWVRMAEDEAIDGVHLRRIRPRGNAALDAGTAGCASLLRGCGLGCLTIAGLSMAFSAFAATIGKELMDLMDTVETDFGMVPIMAEHPMVLVELIIMVVIALVMTMGILLPLVETARGLIENGDASRRIQRTALGEQEAECVYGIRNYLRDFTKLTEADRNALMLWDDFMVYAIALGQNPRVVRELLSARGITWTL